MALNLNEIPVSYNIEIDNPQIAAKIKSIYGNDTKFVSSFAEMKAVINQQTPRENALFKELHKYLPNVISVIPFYYISMLTEILPNKIADIGCGGNMFKDIFPMIHGIDPYSSKADECAQFNSEFSISHTNEYDCAMSINAIHFKSIENFSEQFHAFANVIKPGGRGFLAINSRRMMEKASKETLISLFKSPVYEISPKDESDYLDSEILKITNSRKINILAVNNCIEQYPDESMDGNLRIVFEKL